MGGFLRITAIIIGVVLAVALVCLTLWANVQRTIQEEQHDHLVRETVAFGQRHGYVGFELTRGSCLQIQSEVGQLLVCLPEDGQPTVLIAKNGPEN